MSTKYDQILTRFDELTTQLADEKVIRDNQRWRKLAKERSDMEELAETARKLKRSTDHRRQPQCHRGQ
jgi:peptide chain release factor 1